MTARIPSGLPEPVERTLRSFKARINSSASRRPAMQIAGGLDAATAAALRSFKVHIEHIESGASGPAPALNLTGLDEQVERTLRSFKAQLQSRAG